jgi:putative transcriptional regulator
MDDGSEIEMVVERISADAPVPSDEEGMTDEQLARMKPVPAVKRLRWKLSLSQQEFADRFRIPIGTLRDWEQGRTEPDATARAYIKVIAYDPDMIARCFEPVEEALAS